mmetsp:Transcript_17067/g.25721  ORF Transcript_17067/g.25721 Transcript_17067/m.25721 type:complete len:257 (+) Transcript_17067:113-883(+)|eukprot:scaffold41760_cov128-Skeletonema_dohrnii-CCMP3373.AAC.1
MLRVVAEVDDEERNRPSIRKRAERQTNNMFSSMITVPEDNSTTSAENAIAAAMAANLATADDTISNATPTKRGSMLDDSFRSTNSLVNKMQSALNEEWSWMAKRQHSPPPQDGPPVKTLLLSDNQQHRQSGNHQPTKSRTKKADLIFGLVLLTVGFVIGGIFIHRDKLMYEMNALLGGSTKHHQGDPRQLPIIQHTLTYEERAQLYREKRQAGMLRPINGAGEGKLGIDEQERLRYQQYFGYDQLREGHHQGESKF